jgi:hypothetical protein
MADRPAKARIEIHAAVVIVPSSSGVRCAIHSGVANSSAFAPISSR